MSTFNPFAIEDVAVNSAVSEYVNQTRYSGGVAGLGSLGKAGTVFVPSADGKGWVEAGDAPTEADVYADSMAEVWGGKASEMARKVGLPGWVGPVAGLAALGLGGFFVWKAIKRR